MRGMAGSRHTGSPLELYLDRKQCLYITVKNKSAKQINKTTTHILALSRHDPLHFIL